MTQPHDNWADYYDFVYETTYGNFYNSFTDKTINAIQGLLEKGAIIDYGAGTGRLSIPLKRLGYEITAVEKSLGMYNRLLDKANEQGLNIPAYNCSIAAYQNDSCNLAICLFTVLSYVISEKEMIATINNICDKLYSGGYFFFDLPNDVFFNTQPLLNIKNDNLKRLVTLTPQDHDDIYTYKEICSGFYNGNPFKYEDEFPIKKWDIEYINKLLKEKMVYKANDNFPQFANTGSNYYLYRKK